MLKYTLIKTIELSDWDELVVETYGRPYRFQQQDGCQSRGTFHFTVPIHPEELVDFENDEVPEKVNGSQMGVAFQAWLDRDPNYNPFETASSNFLFWTRNFYPSIDMVINDLYKKGLIEEGDYVIDIDW